MSGLVFTGAAVSSAVDNSDSTPVSVSVAHLKLLHSQKHCDVSFILGTNFQARMSCHSVFLRARSPVFDAMFSQRWATNANANATTNSNSNTAVYEINLPDVTLKPFRSFLEFVYADKWVTTPLTSLEEVVEILKIGHKYDVAPLTKKCQDFIKTKMTLDNVIRIYEHIACLYELTDLKEATLNFMTKNFVRLEQNKSFRSITEYTLLQFLGRDDLPVYELELFQIMIKWANSVLRTRPLASPSSDQPSALGSKQRQVLENILPLIRFPLIRSDEFTKVVVPTNILSQDEVIALYRFFNDDPRTRTESMRRVLSYGFSTKMRSPRNEKTGIRRVHFKSTLERNRSGQVRRQTENR